MSHHSQLIDEVPGLYRVIPLVAFRSTPGVAFDVVPAAFIPRVDALDRVIHQGGAVSPGPLGSVQYPWYMHPHQEDNLMVLSGERHVEIYTPEWGKVVTFDVSPFWVKKDGALLHDGSAMVVWSTGVFHRIRSAEGGSVSLNLATRTPGFDIRNNFDIFEVNTQTGEAWVIREGHLDQRDDS